MAINTGREELLVPENSRVVHIGPSKTGTTAIQFSLYNARDELVKQGVRFASKQRHPWKAAKAAANMRAARYENNVPPMIEWEKLVHRVNKVTEPRAIISSEFLAHATPEAIKRIVTDMDPDRIQVVVTLRPLAKILPSLWQQLVQQGATRSFDTWLKVMLGSRPSSESLWHRHQHDALIRRWADIVGLDRMTVIVVDDTDHTGILRDFEALLGLTPQTLRVGGDQSNRSLTRGEITMIQELNIALKDTSMGVANRAKLLDLGSVRLLKSEKPGPAEERVLMPAWALEQVAEFADKAVRGIEQLDVRVAGDLEVLRRQPISREDAGFSGPAHVPAERAARFAYGLLQAGNLITDPNDMDPEGAPEQIPPVPDRFVSRVLQSAGNKLIGASQRLSQK